MAQLESNFFDITAFDTLAAQDTIIHRIDPRIKVITTFAAILAVVSFDKYSLAGLIPFFLYPVVLIFWGRLSFGFLLKKCIILLPFALIMAFYNLYADRQPLLQTGGFVISGGMISFSSILVRFFITLLSTFALIGSTGFIHLCSSLNRIHVPAMLTVQLLLLYRYFFVLIEEAIRIVQAHTIRSFGNKITIRVFFSLTGSLLIRSIDRAERLYNSMLARGFDGTIRVNKKGKLKVYDIIFLLFWLLFFSLARLINIPAFFGSVLVG